MRLSVLALCALAGCGDQVIVGDAADLAAGGVTPDLAMNERSMRASMQARDLGMPTLDAQVRANPVMVVGAIVDVTAPGADSVVVDYGPTSNYGLTSARVPVGAGGTVSVPVFGLPPATTTHFRVRTMGAWPLAGADLTLAAGPLPADLPTWSVTFDDGTTDGLMLLSIFGAGFSVGYAIIIDRQG